MTSLWLYRWMSRAPWMNYRGKIMVMAFVGTHIPLIALSVSYALRTATTWGDVARSVGVTLVATLVGTAITLFVLDQLLRPVVATSAALRRFREGRVAPSLPDGFADEVGTLMADAQRTMVELDASLRRLERLDQSTGMLNRATFVAELGRAPVGVVRLANFAHISESLGHDAASGALRQVAARLAARLGPEAVLARASEDDLAFRLLPGHEDGGEALHDLVADLSRPLDAAGVRMTPAIRLATAEGSEDAAQALDNAVAAAGTASEGAPVAAHSPALQARLRERFVLEEELRAAIRNQEFVLHFQPVMDGARGRFVGAEALIRWQSPTRGFVPPGAFIPVAEASGLIEPIGLWVLREACREAAGWAQGMKVAVNLGARQFMDEDLDWHVAEAMEAAGLPPGRLEIELTESVAAVDHDHTRRAFGRLRGKGIAIAIDDFGTGYASMSALRRLPFDKLKIDREFVTDVHLKADSQAICGAMIGLGQGLGLQVLAEGTETADEVAWLQGRGCELFQGYHFSRPVAPAALHASFRGEPRAVA
jgi:EAL domain-containing protein (putative c-di-GMP-specific phosphodiesterase class I)